MYFMVMHFSPSLIYFFSILIYSFIHYPFCISLLTYYSSPQVTPILACNALERWQSAMIQLFELESLFYILLPKRGNGSILYCLPHRASYFCTPQTSNFAATHRLRVTIEYILSINQQIFLGTATPDSLTSFSIISLDSIFKLQPLR